MNTRIVRAFAVGMLAVAALTVPAWAGDLLISSSKTFASLDGSAQDDDHTTNGILTVKGNLTIALAGSITNNDVAPAVNAGNISLSVTGNADIFGTIYAENRVTAGNGGNIILAVGGNLTLYPQAVVSSSRTPADGSAGNAGTIILNVTGDGALQAGSVVTASCAKNTSAGPIAIAAGGNLNVDGSVLSQSGLTGTGATQAPGGGPIVLQAGHILTIGDTALVSSKGSNPGADLVHLAGCDVLIYGAVESTGSGHAIPNSPTNHAGPPYRPDKPANSTAAVEVWAGQSLIIDGAAHSGHINTDIGQSGGSEGQAWIDLFASGNITILGPATGAYAVHSNTFLTNDSGGLITIKALHGALATSGRAIQANSLGGGSAGGQVTLEAGGAGTPGAGDVLLAAASVQAKGASSGGGSQAGGNISVRSFSGLISGSAPGELNAFGGGTVHPGSVQLQACAGVSYTGVSTPVATVLAAACGGMPYLPLEPAATSYVTFPACDCLSDITPPQLSGQGANGFIECPNAPVFTAPTATDNFDPAPAVLVVSDISTPGNCAGTYSRTITWQAEDCNHNLSQTVSQTITVVDTTPPTLSGQGANATIECPNTPVFTPPTAHDNCDLAPQVQVVSDVTIPGNCGGGYSRTVTWQAVDCSNNHSSTVSQTITVTGTSQPTLGGQGANATIECPNAPVFTAPTAQDNCDSQLVVSVVSDVTTPGNCGGTYSRTLTWQAVDCNGTLSPTVSQTITVVDTTPPTLSAQGANATIECPNAPVFTPPTAHDNCDAQPVVSVVSDVTTPGNCAGAYSRTITWQAVDCNNNHSQTVSQTITVVDTTPPTLSGQGVNGSIECPNAPVFTPPTAHDNCDSAPQVQVVSDVSTQGNCAGAYSRTITWQAVDCGGNHSQTVSQTITVTDTTPPTLSGQGGNMTVECPNVPQFTPPTAHDNCDPQPAARMVGDVIVPGNCAGTYSRTLTWQAVDCAGNRSQTVSQTITVVDTTPPVLSGQGANATIECPNKPVFTAPTALDNCDPAPSVMVVSDVTTPGNCAGSYSRTITWQAVDCGGHLSQPVSQTITVVDTTPPVIYCPQDIVRYVSSAGARCTTPSPTGSAVATYTVTAYDLCDPNPDVVYNPPSGTTFAAGTTIVIVTATDCNGNKASCSFTVSIVAPQFTSGASFTQGGWGACPHGNNPGALLKKYFSTVYPGGYVEVGIPGSAGYSMKFTSAAAIAAYLPAGSTPKALTADLVNPYRSPAGVFGGQVLALQLNVDFSAAGKTGWGTPKFGGLTLSGTGTSLDGQTVAQILAAANKALGGGALPTGYTISTLNDLIDKLNGSFDGGVVSGWSAAHLAP